MAKDDRGTGNPNHPHVRVGVVGSRRRKDSGSVYDLVESLPKNSIVVSGGCWGPDTWAVDRAKHLGLRYEEYLPDMPSYGSSKWDYTKAYYARNKKLAENVDVLYAFVSSDRSGGTENTIKHAKDLGVEVIIK